MVFYDGFFEPSFFVIFSCVASAALFNRFHELPNTVLSICEDSRMQELRRSSVHSVFPEGYAVERQTTLLELSSFV